MLSLTFTSTKPDKIYLKNKIKMSTIKEFETTTIPPQDPTRHTHTVIFLHGRGDNTRSFIRALRKSSQLPQPFPSPPLLPPEKKHSQPNKQPSLKTQNK